MPENSTPPADEQWAQISSAAATARADRQQRVIGKLELVAEVSAMLFAADPIGINFEHNADEYDDEAEIVVAQLRTASNSTDVQAIVHQCFVHRFDATMAGPPAAYEALAARIWTAWLKSAH